MPNTPTHRLRAIHSCMPRLHHADAFRITRSPAQFSENLLEMFPEAVETPPGISFPYCGFDSRRSPYVQGGGRCRMKRDISESVRTSLTAVSGQFCVYLTTALD